MLPKIGLVTDTDSWAFANIANQLIRHLSDRFEFIVVPFNKIENIVRILLMLKDCNVIHFFWRGNLLDIKFYASSYLKQLGTNYNDFYQKYIEPKVISTAVYDHLYLNSREIKLLAPTFNEVTTGYYVCSERLFKIYHHIKKYPKPMAILEDGVDLSIFYPLNLARFDTIAEREIVIGWAGNSKWGGGTEDFKGLNTILQPAIEQLKNEGYKIKTYFADRNEVTISHDQMLNYYAKLDVYICPSMIEGTPNPVLEAMACGVPIISTNVGVVPQVFGKKQTEYMVSERSVTAIKNAIKMLFSKPQTIKELSEENLQRIKMWDWKIKAEKFAEYFYNLIKR